MDRTGYMIRRKSDNKFSDGASRPRFIGRGKIWWTFSAVTRHILHAQLRSPVGLGRYGGYKNGTLIDNIEIVSFDIHFIEMDRIPTTEL